MAAIAALAACCTSVAPWRDPRIHNLGNVGFGGRVHAAMAPAVTRFIDSVAYGGYDVRAELRGRNASSVDLGCGTGASTSPHGIGVDSSSEMLIVARRMRPDCRFERGLAERWGDADMCDEVHLAFLLHEQPVARRRRILKNALRLCRDRVVVMDIDPSYSPSALMRRGEPYITSYLREIERDLASAGAASVTRRQCVDRHVVVWELAKHP